ncbi:hypothetical protein BKA67DRAFT_308513 [Truncatella angustata]|uniref:Xylanolytic transcriptional activator regulatory domain-containing protein n=1 Tax=Truncatella angustata TaxID=152316 RepID=A0A9P8ZWI5_9PEZI|nr:uncharacterized protein BKA67DRAFT_308513 [Truncatella angustata]KAH6653071.1 hypothetical protein BKA67DRAFT_308513 [Truncatella angustata]
MAQSRVQWLEDQLSQKFGIECSRLPVGTSLNPSQATISIPQEQRQENPPSAAPPGCRTASTEEQTAPVSPATVIDTSEISLLALNAAGEVRYLGPSSGSFFTAYISKLAQTIDRCPDNDGIPLHTTRTISSDDDDQEILSSEIVQDLLHSYEMWIHTLYPLMDLEYLRNLVRKCKDSQTSAQDMELAIVYLVLALGVKQQPPKPGKPWSSSNTQEPSTLMPLSSRLYSRAIKCLSHSSAYTPSIMLIQIILLISIYGSYESVESSQWQLAGLAMRVRRYILFDSRIC